ncbi:hypothetical protein [Streptomyces cellulosae]|uniref:Uncharacterized protein n=1 Tax=Streptomyces cellulosae TaxID=1968 RepID=A0ABW7YCC2_STRCE
MRNSQQRAVLGELAHLRKLVAENVVDAVIRRTAAAFLGVPAGAVEVANQQQAGGVRFAEVGAELGWV